MITSNKLIGILPQASFIEHLPKKDLPLCVALTARECANESKSAMAQVKKGGNGVAQSVRKIGQNGINRQRSPPGLGQGNKRAPTLELFRQEVSMRNIVAQQCRDAVHFAIHDISQAVPLTFEVHSPAFNKRVVATLLGFPLKQVG